MVEDLAPFFADWGEDASLAGTPVRLIFGSPYTVLPGGMAGMGGMSSAGPRALLASASVPLEVTQGTEDALLELPEAATRRPGEPAAYRVTEILPDGTGLTTLLLRAAAA